MSWEHRGDLRADPGAAPGERNIETRGRRNSIWPSIAVVAAIAAFAGVIWYAYKHGREANEPSQPPIIRADTTPVKVKPDQPGGQDIPFQDSTVYDRLKQGAQTPQVERILPPPETPVDRPAAPPPVAPAPDTPPPVGQPAGSASTAPSPLDGAGLPLQPGDASPTVLAPPPGAVTTLPPAPHIATTTKAIPAPRPALPGKVTPPAPSVELKPQLAGVPAKQAMSITALESRALAASSAPAAAANPAPIPHRPGAFRIQLSSDKSATALTADWARFQRRVPELAGLTMMSQKADIPGKGTYYRLQAGPLDESGAKSTCEHVRAQGLGCIVVKQ